MINRFRNLKNGSYLKLDEILSDTYFYNEYSKMMRLVRNIFEWENVPKGFDTEVLEQQLFEHGLVAVFEKQGIGLLHGKATADNIVNFYGRPLSYKITGYNGESFSKKLDDIVLIKNTVDNYSFEDIIFTYAIKLARIEKTIDININSQKRPIIFQTDDKTKLSVEKIYDKYSEYEFYILVDKNFDINNIKTLDVKSEYVVDKLRVEKKEVFNEFLNLIGINTVNTEKKERLITDEANANNDFINSALDTLYRYRVHACNLLNKKFDLNMSVKVRNINFINNEKELNEDINYE